MNKSNIKYGDQSIDFSINEKESLDGKVRIHVLPDGEVHVDSPVGIPISQVRDSVTKRAKWISKNREQIRSNRQQMPPRRYVSGESHLYLGRRYQLKVDFQPDIKKASLKLKGGYFHVETDTRDRKDIEPLMTNWYRSHAKQYFEARLRALSQDIPWVKTDMPTLKLRSMKRHWGNCSKTGVITLNPSLVKAPRHCIDYVIIHELCHLKEHNHSKAFWKLLDRFSPSWEARKSELDKISNLILSK